MDRRDTHRRGRRAIALSVTGLLSVLFPGVSALAAEPVTVTFTSTGAEQTWVVPAGVASIHVVLTGGRGGDAFTGNGFGHVVTGDLSVTPGTTLYVEVGGNGANSIGLPGAAGGFNGGGAGGSGTGNAGAGGGGASDIRTVSRTAPGTLESRRLVAAGGGGRGGAAGAGGGAGGAAGSDGGTLPSAFGQPGEGGDAGTNSAGGAGGAAGGGEMAGVAGTAGLGGTGGAQATGVLGNNGGGGGGGGGGYYGGGGGGGGEGTGGAGGGGGGGSSYVGAASGAFVSPDSTGVPSVAITYTVGPDPDPTPDPTPGGDTGTVDAVISMADAALCLELSTTAIDFGAAQFGDAGVRGNPDVNVTNCGETPMSLLARGTDASGTNAAWNLVKSTATCDDTLGVDSFHLGLREGVVGSTQTWQLGTSNDELLQVPAGFVAPFWPTIDAACPGSSGAGQQMEMQVIFVATEQAQ